MATRTYPDPCLLASYDKYAIDDIINIGPMTNPANPANPIHAIPPIIKPAIEIYLITLLDIFMKICIYFLCVIRLYLIYIFYDSNIKHEDCIIVSWRKCT